MDIALALPLISNSVVEEACAKCQKPNSSDDRVGAAENSLARNDLEKAYFHIRFGRGAVIT